jgi:hypothetical protein
MYRMIKCHIIHLKAKNPALMLDFLLLGGLDQLPSQLAQGMRLKIKSKPTAYIM